MVEPENISQIEQPISSLINQLPGEAFPYQLDARVSRWSQHPFGEPLSQDTFPEYYEKDLKYQTLMQLFHDPHPYVDRFISMGIQGTWTNVLKNKNDTRVVIPAEITFKRETYRGFIAYAIDSKTNVCYHRFFTTKMDRDILYQTVKKKFNENDFPELQAAVLSSRTLKPKPFESSNCKLSQDPINGNVIIEDMERAVAIKLFKT